MKLITLYQKFTHPLCRLPKFFIITFVLAITANVWNEIYYIYTSCIFLPQGAIPVFSIIIDFSIIFSITIFQTYLLTVLFCILPNKYRNSSAIIIWCVIIFLLLIELFLQYTFNLSFQSAILDILADTSIVESVGFIGTYFSADIFLLSIGVITSLLVCVFIVQKLVVKFFENKLIIALVLLISCVGLLNIIMDLHHLFNDEYSNKDTRKTLHNCTMDSRILRAVVFNKWDGKDNNTLLNNMLEYSNNGGWCTSTDLCDNIVFVVGESFSRHHSSLYGYHLTTNPHLSQRSNLYLFNNVVSAFNRTQPSLRIMLSLANVSEKWATKPLLPYIMRIGGYKVSMYSNQCVLSTDQSTKSVDDPFLTNPICSNLLFNYRNAKTYQFDHQLIDEMNSQFLYNQTPNFYFVQLKGQHYSYAQKYPQDFACFNASDITDIHLSDVQKKVVAEYDNATLYNDYVMDKLISMFENKEAIIIYTSDHGQALYNDGKFAGHGRQDFHKIDYEIPLIIWTSDLYAQRHPNMITKIIAATNKPYMTDDIAHLILDIAGIRCNDYHPERSLIDNNYDSLRKRMLKGEVDYDTCAE